MIFRIFEDDPDAVERRARLKAACRKCNIKRELPAFESLDALSQFKVLLMVEWLKEQIPLREQAQKGHADCKSDEPPGLDHNLDPLAERPVQTDKFGLIAIRRIPWLSPDQIDWWILGSELKSIRKWLGPALDNKVLPHSLIFFDQDEQGALTFDRGEISGPMSGGGFREVCEWDGVGLRLTDSGWIWRS